MFYLDDLGLLAGWMAVAAAFGLTFVYGLDAALEHIGQIKRDIAPL